MIREARPGDLRELAELWRTLDRLHAELRPGLFRDGARAMPALDRLGPHNRIFVAERDGALVGTITVRIFDTPEDPLKYPGRRGYVEDLVVAPGGRRKGVGRRLMAAADNFCRNRGAKELLLTVWEGNTAAASLYDDLGFAPVNRLMGRPVARES